MNQTFSSGAAAGFELSISARSDGAIEAVYLRLLDAPVASTREVIESVLLADYTADGALVGLEILGPVHISDLEALVDQARRATLRRFLESTAPRTLIAA